MIKSNMIWASPFMAALFVYVSSCAVSAAATTNAKGKWNISSEQFDEGADDPSKVIKIAEESTKTEVIKTDEPITSINEVTDDDNHISESNLNLSRDLDSDGKKSDENIRTETSIDFQGVSRELVEHNFSKEQVNKNILIEARLLADNIERQYKQLQLTLETEDSYSSKLGEDYFGYGLLLRQANRNDEAIEAFINALHIDKINNGIYSLSQKATLRALFEVYYFLDDAEEFEDYLERILWVENKNPELKDSNSYKLLIQVSNYHLEKFLRRPIAGHNSVQTLLRAKDHLISAIKYHGDKPINEILMPYGELALISFLEGQMQPDLDKTTLLDDRRLKKSNNFNILRQQLAAYIEDPFPDGEGVLKDYLSKAREEKNSAHELKALIALGDLNLLFGRHNGAHKYYQLARQAAESTGQKQTFRSVFTTPTALPNFHLESDRKQVTPSRPTVLVPLTIKISKNGTVRKVEKLAKNHEYAEYFSKARRVVRHITFRPIYSEEGEALASMINYSIRVNDHKAIVSE